MDQNTFNLTDREKAALRLLARGHDAKSAAHELDISTHSLNELLRDARRKVGVTSSREAARKLHDAEDGGQKFRDEKFGLDQTGADALKLQARNASGMSASLAAGVGVILLIVLAAIALSGPAKAPLPSADASAAALENTDRHNTIFSAVKAQDIAAVERLLSSGSDPNEWLSGEGTPLIEAIRLRNVRMVRLLLEKGADPNFAVPRDGSPLIVAAGNGDIRLMDELIARGAQVDAVIVSNETALINAARRGQLEAVKALVRHGADVNLAVTVHSDRAPERRSAVSEAAKGGHAIIVSYLKAQGAQE